MLRNMLTNMLCRLQIAHAIVMAQRDIADIFIKVMQVRIAIVIRFVGAHRMFVPLAGEYALPAYCFKAAANTANTRKEIDKPKGIMWMMRRRRR